jgi:hypothetical protein
MHDIALAPGLPVKLFESNWIHDAHVTGQGAGFVTIQIGTSSKLVRRHAIYVLPAERGRLQQDIQNAINQLAQLQDKLAHTEDPVPFDQEAA